MQMRCILRSRATRVALMQLAVPLQGCRVSLDFSCKDNQHSASELGSACDYLSTTASHATTTVISIGEPNMVKQGQVTCAQRQTQHGLVL